MVWFQEKYLFKSKCNLFFLVRSLSKSKCNLFFLVRSLSKSKCNLSFLVWSAYSYFSSSLRWSDTFVPIKSCYCSSSFSVNSPFSSWLAIFSHFSQKSLKSGDMSLSYPTVYKAPLELATFFYFSGNIGGPTTSG